MTDRDGLKYVINGVNLSQWDEVQTFMEDQIADAIMSSDWLAAHDREIAAKAWDEGVAVALNHAIRNEDGATLRLEHLDGRRWTNPYRAERKDKTNDYHDRP